MQIANLKNLDPQQICIGSEQIFRLVKNTAESKCIIVRVITPKAKLSAPGGALNRISTSHHELTPNNRQILAARWE